MKKQIILLIILSPSLLFASPQMPDYIIFGKDTIATYNLLLEQYLQKQDTARLEKLFGLAFRDGASLNCWRGYQAIYKIEHDSLFLVDIINCGERINGHVNKAESVKKIRALFGDKFLKDKIFIDWFSGIVSFPLTYKVLRWDGVFYKIFYKEKVIEIADGEVTRMENVENYDDDPEKIDRRDKNKISDILYRQLKWAKWKNKEEFDCSDKYIVTIDENGKVSKVRMLYSDQEIEEYYEKDEYNFCINKVYNTLKSLEFDIIKDKGIPISEDIYIEIWIEDNGKIENWTN